MATQLEWETDSTRQVKSRSRCDLDLDSQNISLILQRYFNLYIVPIISDSRGVNLSIWLQIPVHSTVVSIPHPRDWFTTNLTTIVPDFPRVVLTSSSLRPHFVLTAAISAIGFYPFCGSFPQSYLPPTQYASLREKLKYEVYTDKRSERGAGNEWGRDWGTGHRICRFIE